MKGPCLCGVQVLGRTPATGWMLGSRSYGGVSVAVSVSKNSIRRFVLTEKAPTRALIASQTQFHVERPWGQCPFSIVS